MTQYNPNVIIVNIIVAGASYAIENQYADVASGTWTRMETRQPQTDSNTPNNNTDPKEDTTTFGNRQILI